MTYQHPFIKVTFGGTLADGQDIWSCGFHLADRYLTDEQDMWADVVANQDDLATCISDFYNDERTRTPRGAQMEWVKFALIGTDGKYVQEPILIEESSEGALGLPYVPQVSCVVTMITPKFRDPGKYSRFYLPTVSPSGTLGYKMSNTEAAGVMNAAKDFIEEFNGILGSGTPQANLLVAAVSNSGSGHQHDITKVRVGEVLDTQRRRRNSIPENPQETNIVFV